eukprot:IDg6465t1
MGAKLSSTVRRKFVRRSAKGKYSSREIRNHFNAPVSVCRVRQILQEVSHLEYNAMKRLPMLTLHHKMYLEEWERS